MSLLFALAAVACARPRHEPAPVTPSRAVALEHDARLPPSSLKVAVLTPNGSGNWQNTLDLSPAPASVVASCLEPGAAGWIAVNVATNGTEASTTSLAEASKDVSPSARTCIVNALASVHGKADTQLRVLVYITFSPE